MTVITLETVEAAALELSASERSELIERLIDTVLPAPPLHPAWEAEVARRIAELEGGVRGCVPADQVRAEVRAVIESHPPRA